MSQTLNRLGTMAIIIVIVAQWGAILYLVYGIDDGPRCQYALSDKSGEVCPEPKRPFLDEEEEPEE